MTIWQRVEKHEKYQRMFEYPMLEIQIFQCWNASTKPSSIPGKDLVTVIHIMSNARNVILHLCVILQYVNQHAVVAVLTHNPRCSKQHVTSTKLLGQHRQITVHCETTEAAISDETEFVGTFYIFFIYFLYIFF